MFVYLGVVPHCKKPTAHSNTFGFLPTHKAKTKNQKSLARLNKICNFAHY